MKRLCNFFKKIILGPYSIKRSNDHPLKLQNLILSSIWNDEKESTFGLLRLIKLIIVILNYLNITLLIRQIVSLISKRNKTYIQLFVEIYVILSFLFPIIFINYPLYLIILIINIYLIFYILCYLLQIILCSDYEKTKPVSFKRSIILILLNYIQFCICFAYFYKNLKLINGICSPLQAIYFSLVTSTTVGYGDYKPTNNIGMIIVNTQIIISLIFVILIFVYFISNIINEKEVKELFMNVIELPFNKKIGIKESKNEKYLLELDFLPEYLNHINTIHASAQFALAEATSGKYLLEKFSEYKNNILAVVRNADVKYSKPAETRLASTASIDDIDEIKAQLKIKSRLFINVNVKIFDENNNLTMDSNFNWFIQKK